MNNTKKILTILLFLILLTSFFTKTVSADVTINITDDGFQPQNITIKQGEKITFTNKDDKDHWPASDLHPLHELYPDFDSEPGIAPNSSWSFTPIIGKWRFHDHLNPHKKGTIIVEADNNSFNNSSPSPSFENNIAQKIFNKIKSFATTIYLNLANLFTKNNNNTQQLFEPKIINSTEFRSLDQKKQLQLLKDIINAQGVEKAWQLVVDAYSNQPASEGNAHDLAHFIGGEIFSKKGLDGVNICTAQFAFGCFHGLTESAFLNGVDNITAVSKACLKVGPSLSGPHVSCIHGIGHGVATYYQTSDLQTALKTCDTLDQKEQTYCHDGVFMEFELSAPKSFYNLQKPLYPCDSLDSKYVPGCARYQPFVMEKHLNMNFNQIVNACLTAKDPTFRFHCIDALSFQIAHNSQGLAQNIKDRCSQIPDPAYMSQCMGAAAGELVFQSYANWQTEAPRVCSYLSGNYQKSCQDRVNQVRKDYGK